MARCDREVLSGFSADMTRPRAEFVVDNALLRRNPCSNVRRPRSLTARVNGTAHPHAAWAARQMVAAVGFNAHLSRVIRDLTRGL